MEVSDSERQFIALKLELQSTKITTLNYSYFKQISQQFQIDKIVRNYSRATQNLYKQLFNNEIKEKKVLRQYDELQLVTICPLHPTNIITFVNISDSSHNILTCNQCQQGVPIQEFLNKYEHSYFQKQKYFNDIKAHRIQRLMEKKDLFTNLLIMQSSCLPQIINGIDHDIFQILVQEKGSIKRKINLSAEDFIKNMTDDLKENFEELKQKYENEYKKKDQQANFQRQEQLQIINDQFQ